MGKRHEKCGCRYTQGLTPGVGDCRLAGESNSEYRNGQEETDDVCDVSALGFYGTAFVLAFCAVGVLESGRALADLSSQEARTDAWRHHRWWLIVSGGLIAVAFAVLEIAVHVIGVSSHWMMLKYIHWGLDAVFVMCLVLTLVFHGKRKGKEHIHKYPGYATQIVFFFVVMTGLILVATWY